MKVRAARVADADAVDQIRVAAWRAAYRKFMPSEFLASLDPGQNLEGLRAAISATEPPFQTQVAEDRGTVVAYVMFGAPRYKARPGTLELWALNIKPDCWRQGIGRVLVQEVLAAARSAALTRVELWCISGNVPAVSLYESAGFVLTGESRTTSGLTGYPLHEVAYEITP
ncbi:MAG: GNAT family N-acetyltransferase [Ardenticatenales bacterium]|jgi:ribosomal protein S18 acetylase RimI-like enzyme|nr:GNAT family N-acetyltransferase [Ardenticatenales bacterium]